MASMTFTNARAVMDGSIKSCNLKVVDGKIKGVMPPGDTYGKTYDCKDNLVLPGFIDLHTHGGGGIDFNSIDASGIRTVRDYLASTGVTTFLPTVRTDSEETMLRSILSIAKARASLYCTQIYGINMEGPFLAPQYSGSMEEEYLRPCSYPLFKRLQDASGGIIRMITVSPELEGAPQLIHRLAIEGVRVSLGHSGASYDQAVAAIEAGSVSSTHMLQHMKAPTVTDPALASAIMESDCFCELVCDPAAIHPGILRLLLKVKGLNRMIAVSNSSAAAGLGEGLYHLTGSDIAVRGGVVTAIHGKSPSGSTVTAPQMLRYIIENGEQSLPKAVAMLCENPARLLGIYHAKGSLSVGKDADIIVLDKNYEVLASFSCGETLYSR